MDEKKDILKKLKILNENLPELKKIFENQEGASRLHALLGQHSVPASEIGKVLVGNEKAVNNTAFYAVQNYLNKLAKDKLYEKDKDIEELFYNV
ncbi:unnamed protein product, partial [marine sediment metagenome]